MKTLEEKYLAWKDFFWNYFVFTGNNYSEGTFIPYAAIELLNGEKDKIYSWDGTICLSELMQYIYVSDLLNEKQPAKMEDCLSALERLSNAAFLYFNDKFPLMEIERVKDLGFFIRDDISYQSIRCHGYCRYVSSYKELVSLEDEDPCHSPFVSQDQIWNLNPILSIISGNSNYKNDIYPHETIKKAQEIGYNINSYIKKNGYTLYNPYLSYIKHYFTYLPSMNENKVAPWERQNDRNKNYKPDIKVKRGANNWYYSGGTSTCTDFFEGRTKYKNTLRVIIYKGIVFTLDRIYEPILRIFGKEFKHNSYYCYAATSNVWYNKKFKDRLTKQFNKSLEKGGELFNSNLALMFGDSEKISWDGVRKWLEEYPEPVKNGYIESPIMFLIIYSWMKYYNKL